MRAHRSSSVRRYVTRVNYEALYVEVFQRLEMTQTVTISIGFIRQASKAA